MFWCTVSCSYNEINHAADQTKYWIQLSLLIFRSLWSIKEEYVLCSKIAAVEERLLFYFRINSPVMSKKLINTQNKVRKQDYLNYYCYRLWKVNICVCYWQTIYRRRKTVVGGEVSWSCCKPVLRVRIFSGRTTLIIQSWS